VEADRSILGVEQQDYQLLAIELGEVLPKGTRDGSGVGKGGTRGRVTGPTLPDDAELIHGFSL
jgi:hypothetical protein